jgi:hypothetical protein
MFLPLPAQMQDMEGYAINRNETVCGSSNARDGKYFADVPFCRNTLVAAPLPGLPANARVTGINSSGVATGWAVTDATQYDNFQGKIQPFIAAPAQQIRFLPIVAQQSFSAAINDAGEVAVSTGDFVSRSGILTYIGVAAKAINSSGNVVGGAPLGPAQLYRNDVGLVNLNTLVPAGFQWTLTEATAINDLGQIAVSGTQGDAFAAFLMTLPHFCEIRLDKASDFVASSGSTGTLNIADSRGTCKWRAVASEDWIGIESADGTGSGVISYTVAANPGTSPRTATILVEGRALHIVQRGTDGTSPFSDVTRAARLPST